MEQIIAFVLQNFWILLLVLSTIFFKKFRWIGIGTVIMVILSGFNLPMWFLVVLAILIYSLMYTAGEV